MLNTKSAINQEQNPLEQQVSLLKALTHPARIAILNLLRDGEHCVCHLAAYLGYRQAYISQQLTVLRDAGIVQDRRDGWNIYYRVADPAIFEVLEAVQKLTGQEDYRPVEAISPCPCPHCRNKA